MHKIETSPAVMDRVKALRGRTHIFDHPDPSRTAHIIVGLQKRIHEARCAVEIPQAREIVPNVNRISAAGPRGRRPQRFYPVPD
jgi:ureidoacrylate peracid hydrolase